MQPTTVRFPGDVYAELRRAAYERHISQNDIIIKAVRVELGMTSSEADEDQQ